MVENVRIERALRHSDRLSFELESIMMEAGLRKWIASCSLLALSCASDGAASRTQHSEASPPSPSATARAMSPREALESILSSFLAGYLERQPVRATEAGDHRFDDRWPDVSDAGDAAYRSFLLDTKGKLAAIDEASLSIEQKIDKSILENRIALGLFTLDEIEPAENDPLFYTAMIGDGLDPLVTRENAPAAVRAKRIPAVVAVAKRRLKSPPEVHTKTAIDQNKGLVALCESGLDEVAAQAPAERAALADAARTAAASLKELQTFLEQELLPRSTGDFRLGKERFDRKLRLVLDDDVNGEALVRQARALLETTRQDMVATAKELWPELVKDKPWRDPKNDAEARAAIRTVLAKLAEDRSTNTTIVRDAETTLTLATEFVKKHDLVRVPDEPCKIIEMPEYRRGVAIAYCDSSGPLEESPQTFYAISPTPKDWSKERAESFYREYNKSMLFDLTVHEAMPGHFLQAMHNNRFPSKLRAVFWHGAFVEGWAVYTEWLMAKHGFGGARVRMQRQKMALRMAANTILDRGVHAGSMTEKEALALMMDDAFQEEGEAVGKWKRAKLSSAQLTTYFYGFSEMMKLRQTAERRAGFSERAYHDELLAHGSPAPRYMRMLDEQTRR
jgi:uncharacterized protein (DUF885 family)